MNYDLIVQNIKVEYIGEKIFQNEDVLENKLSFRKNNSQYLSFDLLISTIFSMDIYNTIDNENIKSIEEFLDLYMLMISNSIIYEYNKTNPRWYLSKVRNNSFEIVDNIYKKNIYKVIFEINGKAGVIYFNVDEYEFFSNKIKK